MKNKKFFLFFCLLIVVVSSSFVYKHQADTVEVKIEKSNQFTEDEIKTAIKTVKERFKYFKGCQLTDIWYSEKESNAITEDYMKNGRGSENGVKEENIIVLLSNFTVNSSGGDGSFEPNSTQSNWSWTLIRDSKKDKWQVDSWGY